jgi:acyl-CoA synthetase (AMP-forming)/AMP-acid ligase II
MPQVSSVELERVVIASVPAVMEAAAVGLTPPGGGPEQLIMFLVLHQHAEVVKSSPPQAPPSSSVEGQQRSQTQQDVQSTQKQRGDIVGTSSSLDSIWEAFYQVKDVAASAVSRVTDMAVAAAQGDAGSSAGQQQTGPDMQAQQSTQQQAGGDQADLHGLKLKCQQAIRSSLNPLFKLERVLLRDSLPRTASNKVMRRLLRDELRQTMAKM